ncbi:hypothetical protein JJL45_09065 [Tamlana sp. s12]|uniref:hypothetical protein n=1 Tax=Tamlana sp. s12 TaxID=1630406 RepID=UPI0007FDF2C7|nr:hypothetical protein [Tamlana sp. s12]OBQ52894.1 hypothetical protein VQ01_13175 [Tamlana sp. s12]QQY81079.1 hypothetical protein JJL45_09065 [Tamlana sp. s12]
METSTKTKAALKLEKARKMYIELHIHQKIRRDFALQEISEKYFYSIDRLKRLLPISEFEKIEMTYLKRTKRYKKNPK